ncbi:hypothetical protein L9F63_014734 [Diploptera punctata]|uniref:Kinesin-like protein n=1 Tax=Diploptera punctata TaxID=6984 RepID=A0AAD8A7W7_DIPPU|nr:hypothetical protein L9F63_014734 [Diploptera punctata]
MDDSPTTVQVALRIRPLVETEIMRGCQLCLQTVPGEPQVQVLGTENVFTYNYVFGPDESQVEFYSRSVKNLLSCLFKGYNVTILAYGQTGSGKTFSMGTTYTADDNMGIIPRAVNDIFKRTEELEDWDFKITVSFIELYKEQLFDLLASNKCAVDIREDGRGIHIPGLTEVPVTCQEDTIKCLIQGSASRATGATAMNAQSSRSHAIFTINIHQQKKDAPNTSMTAKFHLVDLAGSERSKKTKATGERFKEGVNINRGLLALGNVISALGKESTQKNYISYRDSKLTRLLQDSLGGNSVTLMIACVSPADYNLEETLSTLRYADRAKKIKNKPVINQDPKAAEIQNLKHQIQELRLELLAREGSGGCPPEHINLEKDNQTLVTKNRTLAQELNNALVASTNLYERALMAEVTRERMQLKLYELQTEYGQTVESFSQSLNQEHCPASFLEQLKNFKRSPIEDTAEMLDHELKSAISSKETSVTETAESADDLPQTESDIDEQQETHTLEQAKRTKELQELNQKLALKEELASKLVANMGQMSVLCSDYENSLKDLKQQIDTLQKEKDELMNVLQNVQNNHNTNKVSEQRRKRLQELEQKISSLSKKLLEQEKLVKMKEKNDEKIKQLNTEIQNMKQNKVKLIRQMRTENEKFRAWKQQREKEMIQLRVQDRKRQNEMARMRSLHSKQQIVLKRKVEEAVAVIKRLKDALTLQKSVHEKRAEQELEVLVLTVDLQKTLDQLSEDRVQLHQQLQELNIQLDNSTDDDKIGTEEEIKQLKEEICLRNAQITDLQQKIIASDQENKGKTRWDTIQSMVDAKSALKHLFELAADMQRKIFKQESRCTELEAHDKQKYRELEAHHQQAIKQLEQYKKQIKDAEDAHHQEIVKIEKEHQEKVFVLFKQLQQYEVHGVGDSILNERLVIQKQELEKMEALQKELEQKNLEIKKLQTPNQKE